jgi:hypothetical protein
VWASCARRGHGRCSRNDVARADKVSHLRGLRVSAWQSLCCNTAAVLVLGAVACASASDTIPLTSDQSSDIVIFMPTTANLASSRARPSRAQAVSDRVAQASSPSGGRDTSQPAVPDRLRYVFDLPWCKIWEFRCFRCQKQDDEIVCERSRENCEETFSQFRCRDFNPPPKCAGWSDGCNTCRRNGGCSGRVCPQYRPSFICLREE